MTVRDVGSAGCCESGIAAARVRTTMSIGFPSAVELMSSLPTRCGCSDCESGRRVCSLTVVSVISARGVALRERASGEAEGCGVGRVGETSVASSVASSGATDTETRLLRTVRAVLTLLRFGGDAVLEGEVGFPGRLSGGLNICDGSTLARGCRERVAVRGVVVRSAVLRLLEAAVLRAGAGVYSSSALSSCSAVGVDVTSVISSSESTNILRRPAVRLDARAGDWADMSVGRFLVVSVSSAL